MVGQGKDSMGSRKWVLDKDSPARGHSCPFDVDLVARGVASGITTHARPLVPGNTTLGATVPRVQDVDPQESAAGGMRAESFPSEPGPVNCPLSWSLSLAPTQLGS